MYMDVISILYNISLQGFINGLNSVKLSITFKAKVLGSITSELCFKICGINENPLVSVFKINQYTTIMKRPQCSIRKPLN